ncbi:MULTISPECIES: nucleotidyltransferase family protein [Acidianus]|uniref:Nucleotidyltransferase n=1 Tax=Candidatus Acidianus copahuensis TaxID=1160895 RepID=A0A031LM73_9CREN|nr:MULTISPECIES: nucleotidyltransferase family protein [Acidianus]EZQ06748.1 nucleotidyltransferase [Candidatus Acidianus copahuensis]NON63270.1 nucleotidyltransferase family protein [Acidianus sp. RZ1]
MKALILAGGFGKRLRPLTDDKPKPLIEISGKPILEWQIIWLRNYGISSFIILGGYKKEVLMEWISKNCGKLKVSCLLSMEEEPLGTAGAIYNVKQFLNDEFIVINGDILTNLNLDYLKEPEGVASIALVPLRSPYGVVQTSGKHVVSFVEKPILNDYWINAGVYLLKSKALEYLPEKGDIEKLTFPILAEKKLLVGKKFDNVYWRSIDSVKDVEEASEEIGKAFKDLV